MEILVAKPWLLEEVEAAAEEEEAAAEEEEAGQQHPTTVGLNCCAEAPLLQYLRYVQFIRAGVTSGKD